MMVTFVHICDMERQFVSGANIGIEVTRVRFLSLDFEDNISQVLNLLLEFGIHLRKPRRGCNYALLCSNHFRHQYLRLAEEQRRVE